MSYTYAPSNNAGLDTIGELSSDFEGLSELFGPLIAGARARGVADAFDLMGVAAVLIDATGRVLHASGRAHRALSPIVRITEGHLVGIDAGANDALQRLIAGAVSDEPTAQVEQGIRLYDCEGRVRLFIRAMRFGGGNADGTQLLRSVLVVNEIEF